MTELQKGKVYDDDGVLRVKLKNTPKRLQSRHDVRIINNSFYLYDGDDVEGYIIYYGKDSYGFMIQSCTSKRIKLDALIDIITISIANRINQEEHIFGEGFDPINAKDVLSGKTKRIIVFARRLSAYVALNMFRKQLSDNQLARMLKRDRTSLYYMKYEVEEYIKDDLQIKSIVEDIENEIKTIYNNLKEE